MEKFEIVKAKDDFCKRLDAIKKVIDFDNLNIKIKKLETKMLADDFWSDQKNASKIINECNELKENYNPEYDPNFTNLTLIDEFAQIKTNNSTGYLDQDKVDPLYPEVREYVYGLKYCSMSNIQRTFNVGFNRAGKLFNQLLKEIVDPNFIYFDSNDTTESDYFSDFTDKKGKHLVCVVYTNEEV